MTAYRAMMRAHMRFKPEQKITEMVTLARVAVEEENPTATSSIALLKGCKIGFFTDNPTGKRLGLRNTSRSTPSPSSIFHAFQLWRMLVRAKNIAIITNNN
jgi:hypothetical protein